MGSKREKNNHGTIGARGTVVWAFNQFRQHALVSLMNDLVTVEKKGLTEDQCEKARLTLEFIVNASTSIPDGSFFRRSVYQRLERFLELYIKWNECASDDSASILYRQSFLKKLRKERQRLARTIRKNQYIIDKELDLELLKKYYSALGNLAKSLPEIFKSLAKDVHHFNKILSA